MQQKLQNQPKRHPHNLFHRKIRASLTKILSDCTPQFQDKISKKIQHLPNLKQKHSPSIPTQLRTLQFTRIDVKKSIDNNTVRQTRKNKLKDIIKRYDYFHIPANASKTQLDIDTSIITSSRISRIPRHNKSSLSVHDNHLSYQQMLIQRQNLQDYQKIKILKQVIKQNVKKRSQQLRIYLKKK